MKSHNNKEEKNPSKIPEQKSPQAGGNKSSWQNPKKDTNSGCGSCDKK